MDTLKINQKKMVDLLERMARPDGMHATEVAGVKTMRASKPAERVPILYEPSIIFVAQGRKRGYLGKSGLFMMRPTFSC